MPYLQSETRQAREYAANLLREHRPYIFADGHVADPLPADAAFRCEQCGSDHAGERGYRIVTRNGTSLGLAHVTCLIRAVLDVEMDRCAVCGYFAAPFGPAQWPMLSDPNDLRHARERAVQPNAVGVGDSCCPSCVQELEEANARDETEDEAVPPRPPATHTAVPPLVAASPLRRLRRPPAAELEMRRGRHADHEAEAARWRPALERGETFLMLDAYRFTPVTPTPPVTCMQCGDRQHPGTVMWTTERYYSGYLYDTACLRAMLDDPAADECRLCGGRLLRDLMPATVVRRFDNGAWHEDTYCKQCFPLLQARPCAACHAMTRREDLYRVQDALVCGECARDQVAACIGCGRHVLTRPNRSSQEPARLLAHGWCCRECEMVGIHECAHCGELGRLAALGEDVPNANRARLPVRYVSMHNNFLRYNGRRQWLCTECIMPGRLTLCECGQFRPQSARRCVGCSLPGIDGYTTRADTVPLLGAYERMAPTLEPLLGFELEVERSMSSVDRENMARIVRQDRPWLLTKSDGSLHNGFEIVTRPLSWQWLAEHRDEVTALLALLREAGYRSYDTTTCGLHVHLSRSAFSPLTMYKFLRLIYGDADFSMFVNQRLPEHMGYCVLRDTRVTRQHMAQKAKDFRRVTNNLGIGRYTAVNLGHHATVEVRMFRGTLNPTSFWKALEFCHAAHAFAQSAASLQALTPDAFRPFVAAHRNAYPALHAYLADRLPCDYDEPTAGEATPKRRRGYVSRKGQPLPPPITRPAVPPVRSGFRRYVAVERAAAVARLSTTSGTNRVTHFWTTA